MCRLRDLIGFVPQDDILMTDLTVRENILHSARVRIGNMMKDHRIQQFVESLISHLGLDRVRNQIVGDVAKRGISGGERKRVSVALELAALPHVLVLDEPTSGLDARSALSLIEILKKLTRHHVTVICVIHQPRAEIFAALDDVLLLNSGHQVYLGSAAESLDYFKELGCEIPINRNPADTILDIISDPNLLPFCGTSLTHSEHHSSTQQAPAGQLNMQLRNIRQKRASWSQQLYLAFLRGTKQHGRQWPSLLLEISSGAITGLLIGLANYEFRGHLFQGLFKPPFQLLSSAVSYRLLTEQGILCCVAIGEPSFDVTRAYADFPSSLGSAAGPAGVRTFGNESKYTTNFIY